MKVLHTLRGITEIVSELIGRCNNGCEIGVFICDDCQCVKEGYTSSVTDLLNLTNVDGREKMMILMDLTGILEGQGTLWRIPQSRDEQPMITGRKPAD